MWNNLSKYVIYFIKKCIIVGKNADLFDFDDKSTTYINNYKISLSNKDLAKSLFWMFFYRNTYR